MAEEHSNIPSGGNIIPINIEDEMRGAYIDYSMSVIISRALPDVRDGLKPVHRRILYGMQELGLNWNKPYKKSARIVGEVLGKYHPHGDSAVYETMVRMAQDWSLRYPLIDGQGNFGSPDGDTPAAMRYTEARMRRLAEEMLSDINKNTVDFQPNYDDSTEEPTVLPSKAPNLLINGATGIAVGMATNMAPHNLREVVDATIAFIDNNDITIPQLMQYIKAPDFPGGAVIYGTSGIKAAYETGRGRVVLRAVAKFETLPNGKQQIIVTEVPYLVNKDEMIKRTADLINEKKIEGITEIRNESDRDGVRVVYDLRKDAIPAVVLNNLYKHTALQTTFNINNVALVKGRPMTLNLKELIAHFVEHRHEVVTRRTKFELEEAEKRAHILQGYLIALDNLDEVIALIRNSRDPEEAKAGLMSDFRMSEIQAKAVLDLRLQRLTGMEREKIVKEHEEVMALVADLKDILASKERRMQIIKDELIEIKERYGDERRTQIVHAEDDIDIEDMIADEEMVITISHEGYIKRTPLSEYRIQNRGGTGSKGVSTKEDDFTEHLFIATAHNYLLIFTESGKVYWLKVYNIPEGSKTSKGRAMPNLINIEPGDKVRAIINVKNLENPDYINNNFVLMCTEQGTIKKTSLEAYSRPRASGITAITINEGDRLIGARLTSGNDEIIIALKSGRAIRFNEEQVRPMGRTAAGVRGVTLADENDKVVSLVAVSNKEVTLLAVSEKGYGKRTYLNDPDDGSEIYRVTNRGGKGVKTLNVTEKTGKLVAILDVNDNNEIMIITKSGQTIRMAVSDLRVIGRVSQGVRLIRLNEGDEITSVAKIELLSEEERSQNVSKPIDEPAENEDLPNDEEE
ncbi:MAG: DNA gyrase subunit A [Cytophagaceae bacterium]|nr:DNA gyrase subunit A [Cytophagaceae bacterium]MDW8455174.1 DNA gyrase subunit A [Cytophagaceae bacterium]